MSVKIVATSMFNILKASITHPGKAIEIDKTTGKVKVLNENSSNGSKSDGLASR